MKITDLQGGFVEVAVEDKENALHLIGSDSYAKGGKATVRAVDADKWEECAMPSYTKMEYQRKIVGLIRERYSADDEFAIQRKLLNALLHPSAATLDETGESTTSEEVREFEAYNSFVCECKERAKDPDLYKSTGL